MSLDTTKVLPSISTQNLYSRTTSKRHSPLLCPQVIPGAIDAGLHFLEGQALNGASFAGAPVAFPLPLYSMRMTPLTHRTLSVP